MMRFSELAAIFNAIEKESSRLSITRLLADLFSQASPAESALIAYLSLGNLNPVYVGTKFNFAEKSMVKVIAALLNQSLTTVTASRKKEGDFGLVIEYAGWTPRGDKKLTVLQVEQKLRDFLHTSGTGSQEGKEKRLLELLRGVDVLSAKYIVRAVLGKLRLGFSDMTLLDAFSWMETGDKSLRKRLENSYNVTADIGFVIKTLKAEGVQAIDDMKVTPGIPIRPAAAERLPNAKAIIKKLGACVAQPKLDGFRLQVHLFKEHGKKRVKFFSRNLQEMSDMFPELSDEAKKLPVKNLVAEGEAIAYDVETGTFLPFQETVKRRRKYNIASMASELPLVLYLFDLLYLDGESLLDVSHKGRRKKLLAIFSKKKKGVILPLGEESIETAQELERYFTQNIAAGLEGLVVKREDTSYQPGKRNFNWIKLKRQETGQLDDTLDCVILGYYPGHGKRARFGIGALLVGVYNKKEDRFETIAKIGTGLTDAEWKAQKKACDKIMVSSKPKNVVCAKELAPDVWVEPSIICLIRADEITLSPLHTAGKSKDKNGFALRFPRLMGYRPDKSAQETTTVKEVRGLFKNQFSGKSSKKKSKGQANIL